MYITARISSKEKVLISPLPAVHYALRRSRQSVPASALFIFIGLPQRGAHPHPPTPLPRSASQKRARGQLTAAVHPFPGHPCAPAVGMNVLYRWLLYRQRILPPCLAPLHAHHSFISMYEICYVPALAHRSPVKGRNAGFGI
jgi:hypothetical protein